MKRFVEGADHYQPTTWNTRKSGGPGKDRIYNHTVMSRGSKKYAA